MASAAPVALFTGDVIEIIDDKGVPYRASVTEGPDALDYDKARGVKLTIIGRAGEELFVPLASLSEAKRIDSVFHVGSVVRRVTGSDELGHILQTETTVALRDTTTGALHSGVDARILSPYPCIDTDILIVLDGWLGRVTSVSRTIGFVSSGCRFKISDPEASGVYSNSHVHRDNPGVGEAVRCGKMVMRAAKWETIKPIHLTFPLIAVIDTVCLLMIMMLLATFSSSIDRRFDSACALV